MKLIYKKEIYRIIYKNRTYCRINNQWYYNSGGSELDWNKCRDNIGLDVTIDELEQEFQKLIREQKLERILNEK